MGIKNFEEILAWQKARDLSKNIYFLFKDSKDYSFRDQIQRASVSIMNNIAEGFERKSKAEFKQFLYIAKGSAGEVRSMLILAGDLKLITSDEKEANIKLCTDVSKLIGGFIKKI